MDNPKKSPTILSLCTGYGGLEKGIESIIGKCSVLAHVEIEAFAIANLVNKMETGTLDAVPVWTDLKTFDAKPFRGCVDILTSGYPCQPFSLAGKGKAEEDPRHLWPFVRTTILHARPRQVFLENVLGHLSRGIAEVLKDLESMGYTVKVGIFSAVEVGATHQRKRVFILANSDDMRELQQEGSFPKFWRRSIDSSQELEHSRLFRQEIRQKQTTGIEQPSQKLGNSESDNKRRVPKSTMHGERKPPRGPSFNVANYHRSGINPGGKYSGREEGNSLNQCSKGELDHVGHKRLQKCWGPGQFSGAQEISCSTTTGSCNQWPAPRGCEQWEWEEPRTLVDSELSRTETNRINGGVGGVNESFQGREGAQRKTKSKLGISVDGTINRVDRLRLLGNGVVWQTAAKAYYTLSRKLNAKYYS